MRCLRMNFDFAVIVVVEGSFHQRIDLVGQSKKEFGDDRLFPFPCRRPLPYHYPYSYRNQFAAVAVGVA